MIFLKTKRQLLFLSLIFSGSTPLLASDGQTIEISEPYIDLYTGPSASFPIVSSVERGTVATIVRERGQWFEVATVDGIRGWAPLDKVERTVIGKSENGDIFYFEPRSNRFYELGFAGGYLSGQGFTTLRTGFHFNQKLGAEFSYSTITNQDNNAKLMVGGASYSPFKNQYIFGKRSNTFFTAGAGQFVWAEPKGVDAGDLEKGEATGFSWYAGLGQEFELTNHLSLKADVRYVSIRFNEKAIADEKRGTLPQGGLELLAGFSVYF
jgi:opacity protein-like surface antigen